MRLGSAINKQGSRAKSLVQYHDRSRATVRARANGKCEACGVKATLDWAHLFGRRQFIAEPWCSSPDLTMALCRNCHNAIDRNIDIELRDSLRWVGIARFVAANHVPLSIYPEAGPDPLGAIRRIEDHMKDRECQ